jgi:hydroxymethylpyrimidine/phosphomethylpyrimidine kinase
MKGRVLVVAGSDSGGGAGIQADVKTVTALGGYAATAITALTAQNTRGVFGVHEVPPAFVVQQAELVADDLGADAWKTGMLHSVAVIEAVADVYERKGRGVPLVADPVMVAKGGAPLVAPSARQALAARLLPLAAVATPNAREAEALAGVSIYDLDSMRAAADRLLARGPRAVLVKGGHVPGDTVIDVLRTAAGDERVFAQPRIPTTSTHGTGCTLASAIAVGLAQGLELVPAIERALRYLAEAIRHAPGLGGGNGPIDHGHTVRPF